MFSFSGLNKEQVEELRGKHAIYIVGSGRIDVAGITEANMDRLCEAVASVLRSTRVRFRKPGVSPGGGRDPGRTGRP
jgi:hypothetical protein